MNLYPTLCDYASSVSTHARKFVIDVKENIHYEQIHATAQFALKGIAISFAMWLNPTFFWTSFVVGVLWDKQTKAKLDEVWVAFKDHYYRVVCISALLTVIKLPVALLTYSVCVGLKFGSSLKSSVDESSRTAASGAPY